jgi:hypothetical protein
MMASDRQPHPFDDFVKREVDRQSYDFDPQAWQGLSDMLDKHVISPVRGSLWSRAKAFIKNNWIGITSIVVITMAVSVWIMREPDLSVNGSNPLEIQDAPSSFHGEYSEVKMDQSGEVTFPEGKSDESMDETAGLKRTDVVLKSLPLFFPENLEWEDHAKVSVEPLAPIDIKEWLRSLPEEEEKKHLIW